MFLYVLILLFRALAARAGLGAVVGGVKAPCPYFPTTDCCSIGGFAHVLATAKKSEKGVEGSLLSFCW
eukprot:242969-Amphidinium_carterae.1